MVINSALFCEVLCTGVNGVKIALSCEVLCTGGQVAGPLLTSVDFEGENGCKSQGCGNEYLNSYNSRKLPESIKMGCLLISHSSKIQNFQGTTPICRDPLLTFMIGFSKRGVFQLSEGHGHIKLPLRWALRPLFLFTLLMISFTPSLVRASFHRTS